MIGNMEIKNINITELYPMNEKKSGFQINKEENPIDIYKIYRSFQKYNKNKLADKIKKLLIHKNFNI